MRVFQTLACSVLVDTLGGIQYLYSAVIFSPIKDKFLMDQSTIDTAALVLSLGCNLGIHFGLVLDHYGPRPALFASALLGTISFSLLYFCWHFNFDLNQHQGVMYLALFLQGQAMMGTDMTTVPVISKRFAGSSKGMALGLCKAFLGLSGSLMEQVYIAFFRPDGPSYILFLALWFPFVCLLGTKYLVFVDSAGVDMQLPARQHQREIDAKRVISNVLRWMPALFALLLAAIFSPRAFHDNESPRALAIVLAISIGAAFAFILSYIARQKESPLEPTPACTVDEQQEGEEALERAANLQEPLILTSPSDETQQESQGADNSSECSAGSPSFSMSQALRGADFWCQAVCVLVTWGSSLLVVVNMGQLVEIVGLGTNDKDMFVSLLSVFNCIGRLLGGYVSDYALERGIPRTILFGINTIIIGCALGLLVAATPTALYAVTIIVGTLYGAANVLNPAIIGDLYGTANLATLYGSILITIILGIFTSSKLFVAVYDAHSSRDPSGKQTCVGASCIEVSARICCIACILCGILFLIFHVLKLRRRVRSQRATVAI